MKAQQEGVVTRRRSIAAVLASTAVCTAMLIGIAQSPVSATHSTVTAVRGSAFGYHADNISLFGGSQADTGPTPTVTLAADASNSPQAATAASGSVVYGPAYLFTSGQIDVSTSGSVGETGSVTTSTNIDNVNTSRVEIFGEDNYDCCVPNGTTGAGELTPTATPRPLTDVASTCTASTTGVTGSTTITNGWLYLDSGWSDGDAVYPEPAELAGGLAEHDPVKVALPTNPAPGTTYTGHIHLSATSTDHYTVVFNEQVTNADGSLTVNAVHEYFGTDPAGTTSTLKGDLTIGQSVCGVITESAPHPASADLSVAITDSPDPVGTRGVITYTITVSNAGPDTASGVTVLTRLSGAKFTSANGATCTLTKGKNAGVNCTLGDIAAGGSATFTITATSGTKPGTATASSTASSTTPDPVSTNNTDSESTTVARL